MVPAQHKKKKVKTTGPDLKLLRTHKISYNVENSQNSTVCVRQKSYRIDTVNEIKYRKQTGTMGHRKEIAIG